MMAAAVICQLTWALMLLCVTCGRPSTASQAEEVQEPFNLTVNSYNLNTTLHWDYNTMEMTTYFSVAILNKIDLDWMIIEDCENISHHYCDLSHEIIDPLSYYKVSVQALVGSKTSRPATKEFSLSSVGIFGPPELDVYIKEKIIVVEIIRPELPAIHEIKSIVERYPFHYVIFFGNETEKATDCDEEVCIAKFPISHYGMYCFSAQGISDYFIGFTMEKSKETCIEVLQENTSMVIIFAVIFGVLVFLAIICFVIARWTKARALMPQSLSSVVRSIASRVHVPAPQMSRYDHVSIESPVEEKEKPSMEEKVMIDSDVSNGLVSKESIDAGYQSSVTDSEQKTDEQGVDQSNSSSYFHTDGSSSGINCSDSPEFVKEDKVSAHEPETRKDVKPLPSSFGYDKPHFPKELI